jgi:serine/threonine protein kinase
MTAATYAEAVSAITTAASPSDLFGASVSSGPTPEARHAYLRLAQLVHPDRVEPALRGEAARAFARLSSLWEARGHSATPSASSTILSTRRAAYVLGRKMADGDLAALYEAEFDGPAGRQTAVAKMVRTPANNDLVANEAAVLRHLGWHLEAAHAAFVPQLIDAFRHRDASGAERAVNVLAFAPGDYTSLAEVARVYPDGLHVADAAWVWRRLLFAAGAIARAGVVHGAITPGNVLVEPDRHGLVVIDFSYARVEPFGPLTALVPSARALYPDDVLAGAAVSPATDVVMGSRLIGSLLDLSTVPPATAAAVRAFLRGSTLPGAAAPDNAWALLEELDELLARLFGPRTFRPFIMPGHGARAARA